MLVTCCNGCYSAQADAISLGFHRDTWSRGSHILRQFDELETAMGQDSSWPAFGRGRFNLLLTNLPGQPQMKASPHVQSLLDHEEWSRVSENQRRFWASLDITKSTMSSDVAGVNRRAIAERRAWGGWPQLTSEIIHVYSLLQWSQFTVCVFPKC